MEDKIILNDDDKTLENLYPALVQCFAIIVCGYTAGRLNLISRQEAKGLNTFVSTFSLPCLIFLSLAQLDLTLVNWRFLLSILLGKSVVFFTVLLFGMCLTRPLCPGKPGLYAIFCTQSNDFAIGFPILAALYNKTHPEYASYLYLMAPISLVILNPIAFILMEFGKQQEAAARLAESGLVENTNTDPGATVVLGQNSSTIGAPDSLLPDESKDPLYSFLTKAKTQLKMVGLVFKNIASNPIVLMTVLGVIGNYFYGYIYCVTGVLQVFGAAFSGTALFMLGLQMVGTVQKLKGNALLLPSLLIAIKLLALPLVSREVTSLLSPGMNATETLDLSTFAFLYGTFPTAPAVFVFATQYSLEVDMISTAMVACTFLSAPLMFFSAKMTFLDISQPESHLDELQRFAYDLSIPGLMVGAWLLFILYVSRRLRQPLHKITFCLVFSQMIINIGALLMQMRDHDHLVRFYFEFGVLEFGRFSAPIWTSVVAISLRTIHTQGNCGLAKLLPLFIIIGWGLPALLVMLIGISGFKHFSDPSYNPYFVYGDWQAGFTLGVLIFTFTVTTVNLVLLLRHRTQQDRYSALLSSVNSCNDDLNTSIVDSPSGDGGSVVDIEELAPNLPGCGGGHCSEQARQACSATLREYRSALCAMAESDMDFGGLQTTRHVILCILLSASMFLSIMLIIWTVVTADSFSGIFLELAFLDVMLNVGQVILTFAVLGLDAWSCLSPLVIRWRKLWYGSDALVLPNVEDLSFETTHVCHQFIAHHLVRCEQDLAKDLRCRLVIYKSCFRGSDLVQWLMSHRLTKDSLEAITYASHLLLGRVLRHVDNNQHFSNSDLLYTFRLESP